MCSNHSTLIIYAILLKFPILKILSWKRKSSYKTSIITLWFWFVKNGWNFANNLCIKKEIMNNFAIKIIIDEVYYVKYYCWAWFWWKILYYFLFSFFFFLFLFYIFVCCIPNYTMFVYLLEFKKIISFSPQKKKKRKKIISFSYKKDFVSKCVYIDIKVDNFVHMYITYFRIRKLKVIFSYTYILCGYF